MATEMGFQMREEDVAAAAFEAFTYDAQLSQQASITPAPSPCMYQLGNKDIDLDGASVSIFGLSREQTYQAVGGHQGNTVEGNALNHHPSALGNSGNGYHSTSMIQDHTTQGHELSSSGTRNPAPSTPSTTTNRLQSLPSTNAAAVTTTSAPAVSAGLNSNIVAGSPQVAPTAALSETQHRTYSGQKQQQPYSHYHLQSNLQPQQQAFSPVKPMPMPTPTHWQPNQTTHAMAMPMPMRPPTPTPLHHPYPPPPSAPGGTPETLSDFPHLHRTHHTNGYRDGVTHGRHQASQPAFDAGFPLGASYGLRAGRAIGILEYALAGSLDQGDHEVLRRIGWELQVEGLVSDLRSEMDGHGNDQSNGNGVHGSPTGQAPGQQGQGQEQGRTTMQRFGPLSKQDRNFTIFGEPVRPLSAQEALSTWEKFAWSWVEWKARRPVTWPNAM